MSECSLRFDKAGATRPDEPSRIIFIVSGNLKISFVIIKKKKPKRGRETREDQELINKKKTKKIY